MTSRLNPPIEIRVGSTLVNNDPRYKGRKVKVQSLKWEYGEQYAVYKTGRRIAKIKTSTITQPGEPHHNRGWHVADPRAFDVV